MFPDDLFSFILEQLAEEISGQIPPARAPLQTDSFIARSVMQKAIRRGMTELALRAAATLFIADRRVLWRRLLVTALEDLGVGEVDLLARIVSASGKRAWRETVGGEWLVVSHLIVRACAGTRCQAANDLANIARNDPRLDDFRTQQCDAELGDLLAVMTDDAQTVGSRGVAILLALGEDAGPAAPTHIKPDAGAIFGAFARSSSFSHVAAIYAEAFRQSRLALSPLSLCFWSASRAIEVGGRDDDLPPMKQMGDIPGFALDQYTRFGLAVIRQYVSMSPDWRAFALRWQIARGDWVKAAGELLFRAEGAVVTNRRAWTPGLELYDRSSEVGCFMPEPAVAEGIAVIRRQLPVIDQLRAGHLPPFTPA